MTSSELKRGLETARRLRKTGRNKQARKLLLGLLPNRPKDPRINYQCACVHDALGLEREAIPFYQRAIKSGLAGKDLENAYLGLGSTYRCVGRYPSAIRTLKQGQRRFPKSREFDPFLAMAYFNSGQHARAMELLLRCLADTSRDPGVAEYRRAITFYADKLDKTW